ncbi:MAG: CBS domain-containing protein [Methanomassiliicoccales archaeon]
MNVTARVRDYVNRNPPVVDYGATLRDVVKLMVESHQTGVVVKEEEMVLGVITSTDVTRVITQGRDPSSIKVREFMTACTLVGQNPCIQIHEDGYVIDALRLMLVAGVSRVLVVDSKGDFVGTISFLDALRAYEEEISRIEMQNK